MRKHTIHRTDVIANRKALDNILLSKGMDYTLLHERLKDFYGVDISYKGFMSLISNRASWKLVYAVLISEILGVTVLDIFEIVEVDTEKKLMEKKKWVAKYQK